LQLEIVRITDGIAVGLQISRRVGLQMIVVVMMMMMMMMMMMAMMMTIFNIIIDR